MSCRAIVGCFAALTALASWPAAAQPPAVAATAPAQQTPRLSTRAQTPRPPTKDEGRALGFSVVLVAGDLRASAGGEDDVPPAARKALADMKEFLPYKSYRLLDAAWVLCCGPGRTTTRLRGPEDREYELELVATPGPSARQSIQFVLRDAGAAEGPEVDDARMRQRQRQLEQQLEEAEQRARAQASGQGRSSSGSSASSGGSAEADARRAAEERLLEQRRQMEIARQRSVEARARSVELARSARPIINTSFSMDPGETVVVGTSRLSGGDRALIALLTAVPQKPARQP